MEWPTVALLYLPSRQPLTYSHPCTEKGSNSAVTLNDLMSSLFHHIDIFIYICPNAYQSLKHAFWTHEDPNRCSIMIISNVGGIACQEFPLRDAGGFTDAGSSIQQ